MNILVMTPFGATEPGSEENLKKVARPGTEFSLESIEEVFPLPYTTYRYNAMKSVDGAVERIIKAEQEGYDAVVISCTFDPGLFEARGIVDIPVVGILESAAMVAMMMGQMFSIVGPEKVASSVLRRMIDTYGLSSRCASVRDIGIVARDLYPDKTPAEEVLNRLVEVAKKCVEDGAEIIIPGCSIIGALYTTGFSKDPVEVIGVPVLDPQLVAFKMAEMMVDLGQKVGYPAVSRIGMWKKQPDEEYKQVRQWLATQASPVEYYFKNGGK
jgi:allantoin racemase